MIGMAHCQMASYIQAAIACDPYWDQVTCLLNFEGSDGSTSFIDATGRTTFAGIGDAKLSTSSPLIGNSSLLLEKINSSFIRSSSNTSVSMPSGVPLTLECMLKLDSLPPINSYAIFSSTDDITGGEYLYVNITTSGQLSVYISSVVGYPVNYGTGPILSPGVTYYLKMTMDGSFIKFYVDDIEQGSIAYPHYLAAVGGTFTIGAHDTPRYPQYLFPFDGKIDAVRITTTVRPSGLGIIPTDSYPAIQCI